MTIENEEKSRRIDLVFIGKEEVYGDSVEFRLSIATEEIIGTFNRSFWVEKEALGTFIEGLQQLDMTRQAGIRLTTTDANEFALTIRPKDRVGHLMAEVLVQRVNVSGSYSDSIRIEFECDPTSLPSMISELTRELEMP